MTETDVLFRFLLPHAGVRGVLVRLGPSWQTIRSRADYPPALAALLGEACAAAALFAGHVKVDGRLAVQLKGSAGLRTLFADCNSEGKLRGIALWNDPLPATLAPRALGADAVLAITVESRNPRSGEPHRYQGLVGLDGDRLQHAFEGYFLQSEQLPTRLLLAADGDNACGLLLQQLPNEARDEDGWPRSQALFDTLGAEELLRTAPEELLHRLFHDESPQLLGTRELQFGCSCSEARVADTLRSLGRAECDAALQAGGGAVQVTCEFCNQHYRFDEGDLDRLFAAPDAPPQGRMH